MYCIQQHLIPDSTLHLFPQDTPIKDTGAAAASSGGKKRLTVDLTKAAASKKPRTESSPPPENNTGVEWEDLPDASEGEAEEEEADDEASKEKLKSLVARWRKLGNKIAKVIDEM